MAVLKYTYMCRTIWHIFTKLLKGGFSQIVSSETGCVSICSESCQLTVSCVFLETDVSHDYPNRNAEIVKDPMECDLGKEKGGVKYKKM